MAGPPCFKSVSEMNFRSKQIAPSGGEILNQLLQQAWKLCISVAENTKLEKLLGVQLGLS